MPTDLQAVRNVLISLASDAVGSSLSTIPGPGGTTKPAVLKARKPFPHAPYPYVLLDTGAVREQGLGSNLIEMLNQDDFVEYEAHQEHQFSFIVYGDDAVEIASNLKAAFRRESVRSALLASDLYLAETSDIIPSSELFGGEYIEIATFDIILGIAHTFVNTDEGYFDSFIIDGELYEGIDDPDPLTINITV